MTISVSQVSTKMWQVDTSGCPIGGLSQKPAWRVPPSWNNSWGIIVILRCGCSKVDGESVIFLSKRNMGFSKKEPQCLRYQQKMHWFFWLCRKERSFIIKLSSIWDIIARWQCKGDAGPICTICTGNIFRISVPQVGAPRVAICILQQICRCIFKLNHHGKCWINASIRSYYKCLDYFKYLQIFCWVLRVQAGACLGWRIVVHWCPELHCKQVGWVFTCFAYPKPALFNLLAVVLGWLPPTISNTPADVWRESSTR